MMLLPRSHESVIAVGIGDTMNRRGYLDASLFQLFFHFVSFCILGFLFFSSLLSFVGYSLVDWPVDW